MKNFFKIIFVTFILLLFPIVSQASCNVVVDGSKLICYDTNGNVVEPFVFEGTTYVPVRGVAQAFDIPVAWEQETKTVHLGKTGGTPTLGDEINIFFNGERFICYDVSGNAVHPILHEGTTYLPIRGIGSLFGKNIYWDNLTQTATLTTPPNEAVISYLKSSVDNTAAKSDINASVTFDGTLSFGEETFSHKTMTSTEKYSPVGFSLSMFLPADYLSNVSYLGDGKFFLVLSSEKFATDPDLQKELFMQNTPTAFSSLYMYISTKGGYVTAIKIYLAGDVVYNNITFDQTVTFDAILQYPSDFKFPPIPYPDKATANNENPVSATVGEKEDATLIGKVVAKYMESIISANPRDVLKLLHISDYNALYSHKTNSQINTELASLQKKLSAEYSNLDITYSVDSLVYIETDDVDEKAAKACVTIIINEGDGKIEEQLEIFLKEKDGAWYLDPASVQALYKM